MEVREDDVLDLGRVQAEFLVGTHHAMGFDAADLADLDGERLLVAQLHRQRRAGQDERHLVTRLEILRAAHDLAFARAVVDAADGEFVGVGMLVARDDLGDQGQAAQLLNCEQPYGLAQALPADLWRRGSFWYQ